jgi:hypothetical protein
LAVGGEIIKVRAGKHRSDGRPIFGKDSKSAAYKRDASRFFSGHDLTQKGPRWTAKAVPHNSATKRDAERKAGISHQDFAGAVIEIGGKLRSKAVLHAVVDQAPVDLVSDAALAASAKRGGRSAQQALRVVEDKSTSPHGEVERCLPSALDGNG